MANCKMFGGLFKPKFYNKCKAAIKLTKVRLEMINRKRDAMLKFLKKDIADLLKKDLDSNAYGRVEGLLAEQNITRCYKLIEEFCECVLDNLSNMTKQSECPEDCREAVASLAFAAARFADLPELRNLRSLLYEKYGKSIEIFINNEFASRLKPEHPSKEMKVQLMRDIAVEFSIEWDSKPLEQKLLTPPPKRIPTSQKSVQETREDEEEEEEEERIQAHVPREKPNSLLETENKFVVREKLDPKETQNVFRHHLASSESSSQETIDVEDQIPPPNTEKEEEVVEEAKMKPPYSYKNIPPPYRKEPKLESSSKPKPRSVRQRRPRPLTETSSSDVVDGEEKVLDGLLTHYSSKKSPYEVAEEPTSSWWWKGSKASEAKKAVSLEQEKTKVEEEDQMKRHHRASSLGQSEMLGGGHVHPKLPEYEELAARIAKLSGET